MRVAFVEILYYSSDIMKKLGKRGEAPIVVIRLPLNLLKSVRALAKSEDSTVSSVVRRGVELLVAGMPKPKRRRKGRGK